MPGVLESCFFFFFFFANLHLMIYFPLLFKESVKEGGGERQRGREEREGEDH